MDKNLRSKGYGSHILEKIQILHPYNKIIISIESSIDGAENLEQRLRRKKNYINNEYLETGYFMKLGGQKQEIIIKNGVFNKRD